MEERRVSVGDAVCVVVHPDGEDLPQSQPVVAAAPRVIALPDPPDTELATFAPVAAEVLQRNVAQLRSLADEALIVSSRRSARALESFDLTPTVVNPPVAVSHLHHAVVSASTQQHLRRSSATPTVFLALGPIVPDAHISTVLTANNVVVTSLVPEAQLIVAGPAPVPRYLDVCELYSREMNTNQTWLATSPTVGEYAAFLRHGTVLIHLDTSNRYPREGIEAMSFGIPVVGRAGTVLHELVPDAGIFLSESDGAAVIAEALFELATNQRLHDQLGQRARRAATIFSSPDAFTQYDRRLLELAR